MAKEAGNAATSAVADVVNQTAAPFQNLKKPTDVFDAFAQAQAVVGAVAGLANAPTEFLNNAFARATNGIAKALPSFPAAILGSLAVGIPHTHTHPPAMPVPLPGIGAVLTACPTVLIGGMPAARSGDFGVSPTCGSVSPVFEIFTGSSKVFIGGARAARMTDFTKACTPKSPAGAGAGGAMSKMGKAMAAGQKALGTVGKVSMYMGVGGAALKVLDKHMKGSAAAGKAAAAADAADAAADATAESIAAAEDAASAASAEAAAAAGEATAAMIAAVGMGLNLAMDAVKTAMGTLMGKDPGAPPCIGMITLGIPTVLIGGFPMPSWSDVAKGLKKLMAMLARARRAGKSQGRSLCLKCM